MCVFVAVLYLKTKIGKNGASLDKGGRRKGDGRPSFQERTEDLQKTLHACPDYNTVRGAENVSTLSYIGRKRLTEICFSLRFSVGEKPGILAEGAFHVPPP